MEDQVNEINSVKAEFGKYKEEMDESNKKNELKLSEMQRLYEEVSDEKEIQT